MKKILFLIFLSFSASSFAQNLVVTPNWKTSSQPVGGKDYSDNTNQTLAVSSSGGLFIAGSAPAATATSYSNYVSSAAENSEVVKASAGRLYGVIFSNANASARYFQCANSTTLPSDATVPSLVFYCPASQVCSASFTDTDGLYFSTGISCWNSTTQNTKTLGSADSLFNIIYK